MTSDRRCLYCQKRQDKAPCLALSRESKFTSPRRIREVRVGATIFCYRAKNPSSTCYCLDVGIWDACWPVSECSTSWDGASSLWARFSLRTSSSQRD